MSSSSYNPNPPRAWSRVQHSCSFAPESQNDDGTLALTQFDEQMRLKGNILQYKNNSLSLTKNERYARIAKGIWASREKTYATQTDTYTNPNTLSLLRLNYKIIDDYNNFDPFYCGNVNGLKDGGSLICNVKVKPCTEEIIQRTQSQTICHPSTDSNVPGPMTMLCWKDGTPTWYPRQTYVMTNSGNKWPVNYKLLVRAGRGCVRRPV